MNDHELLVGPAAGEFRAKALDARRRPGGHAEESMACTDCMRPENLHAGGRKVACGRPACTDCMRPEGLHTGVRHGTDEDKSATDGPTLKLGHVLITCCKSCTGL